MTVLLFPPLEGEPEGVLLTTNEKRLYIAASNETDWGIKKAYLTLGKQEDATRGYRFGKDALSIASGLNYYSDESFSTPLSLYTIADNEALMQDIRDTELRSNADVPVAVVTTPEVELPVSMISTPPSALRRASSWRSLLPCTWFIKDHVHGPARANKL